MKHVITCLTKETGSNCEQISVLIKLSLSEKYYRKPNQPEFDILGQEGKSVDAVPNWLMRVLGSCRVRRKGMILGMLEGYRQLRGCIRDRMNKM